MPRFSPTQTSCLLSHVDEEGHVVLGVDPAVEGRLAGHRQRNPLFVVK